MSAGKRPDVRALPLEVIYATIETMDDRTVQRFRVTALLIERDGRIPTGKIEQETRVCRRFIQRMRAILEASGVIRPFVGYVGRPRKAISVEVRPG
jgi:hypothetical protein